jgi:hypothetical protein
MTIGDTIVIVVGGAITLCIVGIIFHMFCGEDEIPQLSSQDHSALEREQYVV